MLNKYDITVTLGREIDEIDNIRRCFEGSYTENYSNPQNGDFISDDYFEVIDLTTKPGKLSNREVQSLNRAIGHLNEVYPTIEDRLGRADLLETYDSVSKQVNAINATSGQGGEISGILRPPLAGLVEAQ